MKIVIVSGYMDPIHQGHIEYFKLSKDLAGKDGKLVVIVNNDNQAILKKGKAFMKCDDRIVIIKELRCVDDVVKSIDVDRTVCKTIEHVHSLYKDTTREMYFCNGGDAFNIHIPETDICNKLDIELVDGLGNKVSSSSWLTGVKKIDTVDNNK